MPTVWGGAGGVSLYKLGPELRLLGEGGCTSLNMSGRGSGYLCGEALDPSVYRQT